LQYILYIPRPSIPDAYHWKLINSAIFQFASLYFTSGKKKVHTHEKIELIFPLGSLPLRLSPPRQRLQAVGKGGVPVIGAYRITSCAVRFTWDLILQLLLYAFTPGVEPEALGSRWSMPMNGRGEDKVAAVLYGNVFSLLKRGCNYLQGSKHSEVGV
jgi:hypothetical protein